MCVSDHPVEEGTRLQRRKEATIHPAETYPGSCIYQRVSALV